MVKDELIEGIEKKGHITEQEIKLVCRRLNSGKYVWNDVEGLLDLKLTPSQTEKGYKWLMSQWKTPRGVERETSPFGYREQGALETFEGIRLNSFTDRGRMGFPFWIPVYDVIGRTSGFQYVLDAGKVAVIG